MIPAFPSGVSYDADALIHFGRMSPGPDITLKGDLNDLIVTLKNDGIWSKLDVLCVPSTNEGNSLLDLTNNVDSTNVNSCAFVSDQGFTVLTAGAKYINTNFLPDGGSKSQLDDCSFFAYVRTTNALSGTGMLIGSQNTTIFPLLIYNYISFDPSTNNYSASVQTYYGNTVTTGGEVAGFFCGSRISSSEMMININGATTTGYAPSVGIADREFYVGAVNVGSPGAYYNNNQMACWGAGAGLDALGMVDLYNAIQAYMTARGTAV